LLERHIPNDGELGRMAIVMDGIAMIRNQFAIVGQCHPVDDASPHDGDFLCWI
jgi:hypothetical protein